MQIREALMELPWDDGMVFNSGGAFGIDTFAYEEAKMGYPDATHRVYLPAGERYNRRIEVQATKDGDEVILVEGGYMKRNDALIANCDVLLAFPNSEREELRSGTWAAIRRARKAGKIIRLYPLS